MSEKTPFFGFGPAPQPPHPQTPEPGWAELYCDMCEGRIEAGDQTVQFFIGRAARSPQTGYLTTMPDARYSGKVPETTDVHLECAIEHVLNNICPEQADDILSEQVMEMANELFEEWKANERLEDRLSDPDA